MPLPILIFLCARLWCRSWASVFMAINSTSRTLERIIWLTALAPEPPTPTTFIRAKDSISGLICGICLHTSWSGVLWQEGSKPFEKRARAAAEKRRERILFFQSHERRSYRGRPRRISDFVSESFQSNRFGHPRVKPQALFGEFFYSGKIRASSHDDHSARKQPSAFHF